MGIAVVGESDFSATLSSHPGPTNLLDANGTMLLRVGPKQPTRTLDDAMS